MKGEGGENNTYDFVILMLMLMMMLMLAC